MRRIRAGVFIKHFHMSLVVKKVRDVAGSSTDIGWLHGGLSDASITKVDFNYTSYRFIDLHVNITRVSLMEVALYSYHFFNFYRSITLHLKYGHTSIILSNLSGISKKFPFQCCQLTD